MAALGDSYVSMNMANWDLSTTSYSKNYVDPMSRGSTNRDARYKNLSASSGTSAASGATSQRMNQYLQNTAGSIFGS